MACALALGPSGATVEVIGLQPVVVGDVLRFEETPGGEATGVVTEVDSDAFAGIWLGCVETADRRVAGA